MENTIESEANVCDVLIICACAAAMVIALLWFILCSYKIHIDSYDMHINRYLWGLRLFAWNATSKHDKCSICFMGSGQEFHANIIPMCILYTFHNAYLNTIHIIGN